MLWWIWILIGLALLGLEISTPGGFFVLFFGLAALVVGALAGVELTGAPWVEWLLFSILSVVSLLTFRGPLLRRFRPHEGKGVGVEGLVGEIAVLTSNLGPGEVGKAELRGTSWSVRSRHDQSLKIGQRCRVERVEGLMLWVRAE